jgi:hypothetical protein
LITSKQIINLSEEWVQHITTRWGVGDIYRNPSSSDYRELYSHYTSHAVRFMAYYPSKECYVWDINLEIHYNVAKLVGLSTQFNASYNFNLLSGYASLQGGKFFMTGIDVSDIFTNKSDANKVFVKQLLSKDWSWLKKYIDYTNYFKKLEVLL